MPAIVNDELESDIFEAVIDGRRFGARTGMLLQSGRQDQLKRDMVAANDWFYLDVIAVARRIVITVRGAIRTDLYDSQGKYRRGHLALHHFGDRTEVRFRKVEVRSLDLGNDPAEVARGGQPRSLVARSFNGKQYMAFSQQTSWDDARRRCRNLGGRLALPINEQQNRFLTTLTKDHGIEGVWLGASDKNLEEQLLSVDNYPVEYTNWDDENLEEVDERSQQHYPVLLVSRDGKWAYQPNNSIQYRPGYICQWD